MGGGDDAGRGVAGPVASLTLLSSASVPKPRPYTVLARTSDHWPNFCDVLVKVMLGVMVELMTACQPAQKPKVTGHHRSHGKFGHNVGNKRDAAWAYIHESV